MGVQGVVKYSLCGAVGALLCVIVAFMMNLFDIGKEIQYTDHQFPCKIIPETSSISGAEDITMVTDSIALLAADDRARLWHFSEHSPVRSGGPMNTPDGAIYTLEMSCDASHPTKLNKMALRGWNASIAFHPHGIFLHRQKNLVFVINHAYGRGGERIDVFRLDTTKYELEYVYTLRNSDFFDTRAMGRLNDVVVIREGELYVTTWSPYPDHPTRALLDERGLFAVLRMVTTGLRSLFGQLNTHIYHCTWDSATGDIETTCRIVANGPMFNGIQVSPALHQVLAVDVLQKSVHVFDRDAEGTLTLNQTVPLPHSADNIEFDAATNAYYLGSICSLHQALRLIGQAKRDIDVHNELDKFAACGGVQKLMLGSDQKWQVTDLITHNGSLLSGIALGVPCCGGAKLLLGSWGGYGVLACPQSNVLNAERVP